MNNKFDWARFCNVIAKDFRSMWTLFGSTMLILALLPTMAWLLAVVFSSETVIAPGVRVLEICLVAAFASLMAPSRMYRTMNLRNEGIYYAMLPASKLEKYLSMLVYCFIVCPLLVYVGGMVVDMLLTVLPFGPYYEPIWKSTVGFPFPTGTSDMTIDSTGLSFGSWAVVLYLTSFLCSASIFLFTATLFRRHKVLYTFLWMWLIDFVLVLVGVPLISSFFRGVDWENAAQWIEDRVEGITEEQLKNWVVAVLFSYFAWYRLKKMAY